MMSCDPSVLHDVWGSTVEHSDKERVGITSYEDYLFTVVCLSSTSYLVDPSLHYDALQEYDHLVQWCTVGLLTTGAL